MHRTSQNLALLILLFINSQRHLWTRLEDWFRLNGYELFVRNPPGKAPGLRPRNLAEVRAPDQYHAIIPDGHHVDRWTASHKVHVLLYLNVSLYIC